jgi:hypothetical protein
LFGGNLNDADFQRLVYSFCFNPTRTSIVAPLEKCAIYYAVAEVKGKEYSYSASCIVCTDLGGQRQEGQWDYSKAPSKIGTAF